MSVFRHPSDALWIATPRHTHTNRSQVLTACTTRPTHATRPNKIPRRAVAGTADSSKPWDNKQPAGPWLDVPTAQTYAALLSADPPPPPVPGNSDECPPPPPLIPKRLLLIDLHDDIKGKPILEASLRCSGKWSNPVVPYDLATGTGTFFASAFHTFLRTTYAAAVGDVSKLMVVFPDVGAYRRFVEMVRASIPDLQADQVRARPRSQTDDSTRPSPSPSLLSALSR